MQHSMISVEDNIHMDPVTNIVTSADFEIDIHHLLVVRSLLLILIRPDLPFTVPTRHLSSLCKLKTRASEFSRYL